MIVAVVSWLAVGLLLVTSTGLLLTRDWRWSLGLLAAQYLAMFWLVLQYWPFGMAAVKLVTGWMVSAAIGITRLGLPETEEPAEAAWPQGRLFRLFAAGIVVLIAASATPGLSSLIANVSPPVLAGSLILMGMGLLHLGITGQVLRVVLGLLTVLAGFETLYAALESSILVAALLAVVDLGLALAGAYLLTSAAPAEESA
ncbi:MAG: hypothetical protein AB1564_13415 [Chloroflexota bacterium]